MVGIRRTDGGPGCPPTEAPTDSYQSPFRVDSNGALWITNCFTNLIYFGEARHDLPGQVAPGSDSCKVSPYNYESLTNEANAITAGKYTTRQITNTTPCTIGILLAHNMSCDLQTSKLNWVHLTLSERWNGKNHASATVSSRHHLGDPTFVRTLISSGAAPHDVNAPNGGSSMQLAPGESATVSCRLFLAYPWGSPLPGEMIQSASSAVRIYGYVLG
jgi:hypothetical protein